MRTAKPRGTAVKHSSNQGSQGYQGGSARAPKLSMPMDKMPQMRKAPKSERP